jgi:small-conductance mechanosensitive channel
MTTETQSAGQPSPGSRLGRTARTTAGCLLRLLFIVILGIGRGVRGLLLVVTTVLAVEQLGLNLTFLTDALTNLLTIVVAGLALAFGPGGRDVVRNVLAGYYARDQFAPGEGLVVDGEVGTVESIGTVNSLIAIGEEVLVVPNASLTGGTIRVRKAAPVERDTNWHESAFHPES